MSEEVNSTNQPASGGTDGKTMSIISYLWWPGWIIALIMNMSKKDDLASFHIRQMLGLLIFSLLGGALRLVPKIGNTLSMIVGLGLLVLWIIGLIGAFNAEKKIVPIIGDLFQDWFKGI